MSEADKPDAPGDLARTSSTGPTSSVLSLLICVQVRFLLRTTDMSTEEPDATIASRGHSTNLVGLPTGLLASASFNDFPIPLCIGGTREAHRSLFERLNTLSDANEAGKIFQDYTALVFGLDHVPEKNERRRYRASYLRLLKDWGFDSNSAAGAVLKAVVIQLP